MDLSETQAITEMAKLLYNFLPGKPHPYADQSISFLGIAYDMGLEKFWTGGSKLPAITTLLEKTLEYKRDSFCKLILNIVKRALNYRNNKNDPIMMEEIKQLNELILKVKFKIPELCDSIFLHSLQSKEKLEYEELRKSTEISLNELKTEFEKLLNLKPQKRGYEFEKFLKRFFDFYKLDPKSSFKIVGEQIDGSFQFKSETYLVEAKWQNKLTPEADLLVLSGKVGGKAKWSRGVFISYTGFSDEALAAFSKGKSINIIGINGQDIHFILEGKITLPDALREKLRIAAETGDFYVSVFKL